MQTFILLLKLVFICPGTGSDGAPLCLSFVGSFRTQQTFAESRRVQRYCYAYSLRRNQDPDPEAALLSLDCSSLVSASPSLP